VSKLDVQKEIYPKIISNQTLAFKPTHDKLQSPENKIMENNEAEQERELCNTKIGLENSVITSNAITFVL